LWPIHPQASLTPPPPLNSPFSGFLGTEPPPPLYLGPIDSHASGTFFLGMGAIDWLADSFLGVSVLFLCFFFFCVSLILDDWRTALFVAVYFRQPWSPVRRPIGVPFFLRLFCRFSFTFRFLVLFPLQSPRRNSFAVLVFFFLLPFSPPQSPGFSSGTFFGDQSAIPCVGWVFVFCFLWVSRFWPLMSRVVYWRPWVISCGGS